MTQSTDLSGPSSIKLEIPTPLFLEDHQINGRPVLAGAHATNLIAKETRDQKPEIDVTRSGPARFLRLLPLEKNRETIEAEIRISDETGKCASAALYTRRRAGRSSMIRSKKHVEVQFRGPEHRPDEHWDILCGLEGVCLRVDAKEIYDEVVDFGPSFHNIVGTVYMSQDGALGRVKAPVHENDFTHCGPLGSFFPIDAAFHMASAWSTRYTGRIVFPTGYSHRVVVAPPLPGQTFYCRVLPKCIQGSSLEFDIYLHEADGAVVEKMLGVSMTDFPGKDHRAPLKMKNLFQDDLPGRCTGFSIVELETVPPYADRSFSESESARYNGLGPGRKRSFAAAHLALKRLARRLGKNEIESNELCTVAGEEHLPVCPAGDVAGADYASAAHDDRFAVAVTAGSPVGVDVEKISGKVERAARFFLTPEEEEMVRGIKDMQRTEALTRIWCTKESATKALHIPLAESFKKVRVSRVDPGGCIAHINEGTHTVLSAEIDGHIISVLVLGPAS